MVLLEEGEYQEEVQAEGLLKAVVQDVTFKKKNSKKKKTQEQQSCVVGINFDFLQS